MENNNTIENILDDLVKESPELMEDKNKIRKLLLSMQENTPDVLINSDFKKALKNKLEIQNYAKLKNTQNKKINIAQKGTLSFKKDSESIFEKPKLNFLKLLSPVFVGCFGIFGFFHFFGDSLFQIQQGGELEYTPSQIQETSIQEPRVLEIDDTAHPEGNNIENTVDLGEIQGERVINIEEELELNNIAESIIIEKDEEKTQIKNSIAEKIKKRNAAKVIERAIEKEKVEDDFTKSLIEEMGVGDNITVDDVEISADETSEIVPESLNSEILDTTNEIDETEIIIPVPLSDTPRDVIIEESEDDSLINTEIIDLLGEENADNLINDAAETSIIEPNIADTVSETSAQPLLESTSLEEAPQQIPFELYCEEKGGTIEENICTFGTLSCSENDFSQDLCE